MRYRAQGAHRIRQAAILYREAPLRAHKRAYQKLVVRILRERRLHRTRKLVLKMNNQVLGTTRAAVSNLQLVHRPAATRPAETPRVSNQPLTMIGFPANARRQTSMKRTVNLSMSRITTPNTSLRRRSSIQRAAVLRLMQPRVSPLRPLRAPMRAPRRKGPRPATTREINPARRVGYSERLRGSPPVWARLLSRRELDQQARARMAATSRVKVSRVRAIAFTEPRKLYATLPEARRPTFRQRKARMRATVGRQPVTVPLGAARTSRLHPLARQVSQDRSGHTKRSRARVRPRTQSRHRVRTARPSTSPRARTMLSRSPIAKSWMRNSAKFRARPGQREQRVKLIYPRLV